MNAVDAQERSETGRYAAGEREYVVWVPSEGVWGGALRRDRDAAKDLPVAEAAEVLEATFDHRLQERIAAWLHIAAIGPSIAAAREPRDRGVAGVSWDWRYGYTAETCGFLPGLRFTTVMGSAPGCTVVRIRLPEAAYRARRASA